MITTAIIILSILFQLSAVICALCLIRLTGKIYSWILISAALLLMTVRRFLSLYYIFSNLSSAVSLPNEIIGLIISIFMLSGVIGIRFIFIDHIYAEEKINSLLKEKELILKEVNHRIKNNMNTIHSLLFLQSNILKDPAGIDALNDAASRVQSMAVLYDKLYRSRDFQKISVMYYLPPLIDEIAANFPISKSVKIEKNIEDFILHAKTLQSLGIIINELLTNIMKYAFTGRDDRKITVEAFIKRAESNSALAETRTDSTVCITVQDNGIGIPDSVDFENSTGFGLQLVWMLTQELKGNIQIERGNGTKIILEFKT